MSEPPPPPGAPAAPGTDDQPPRDGRPPLGVGELLDATVGVVGRSWQTMLASMAVIHLLRLGALTVVALSPTSSGEGVGAALGVAGIDFASGSPAGAWRPFLVSVAVAAPFLLLIAGASTHVTARQRAGQTVTVRATLRAAIARFPALVGSHLVVLVAVAAAAGTVLGAGQLLNAGLSPAGAAAALVDGLAVLVAVLVAIAVAGPFVAVTSAIVIEGRGPGAALRRSLDLVRGCYAFALIRVVAVAATLLLGAWAVDVLVLGPLQAVAAPAAAAVTVLAQIAAAPLIPVALVLISLDLGLRPHGAEFTTARGASRTL